MIKQILGTTFSRIIITLGGIVVLFMNTRFLGAQKLGELSLILIALNLILQVSELIGGPSLVYLQKKYQVNKLLSLSYLWSIVVAGCAYLIMHLFFGEITLVFVLSLCAFVQSINHTHLHLLVGKEYIKNYNISTLVQIILVVILILVFYLGQDSASVSTYLWIYFIGQLFSLVFSTTYLSTNIRNGGQFGLEKNLITEAFKYGYMIQLANIFQFGVYRINYIILESFTSLSTLGVFSLGIQLSEKALIPCNAISMVQYAKISNSDDKSKSNVLTIHLVSLSLSIAVLTALTLVCLPGSLIVWLFGSDFILTNTLFYYLAPGILFMSVSVIYSHYFAGLGKYHLNTITSLVGVIIIAVLSYLLIPIYDMKGAALATSAVYFVQMLIQSIFFKRESNMKWSEIISLHRKSFGMFNLNRIKDLKK
ncbi:MAG: hypothetical protein CL840_12180 [Crocinitomicaceae bacterium]|nr:hypothetical protein [Crocinitomicaceae bacterium]|tara:strand:- start:4181 stop:5449 length:1269 start_codon:yes stop_codon:yes gene_type:complete